MSMLPVLSPQQLISVSIPVAEGLGKTSKTSPVESLQLFPFISKEITYNPI